MRSRIALFTGGAKGIDFVRHIRNAFAHRRNAQLYPADGQTYIRLLDYGPDDGSQTAFIAMPAEYLQKVFDLYASIEAKLQQ